MMQSITDNPFGYIALFIIILVFARILGIVMDKGIDKLRTTYSNNNTQIIAVLVFVIAIIFFVFASPVAKFIGVQGSDILFISVILGIVSLVVFMKM